MDGREVAVVGTAMTPFGEREASLRDLLTDAGSECLADAGAPPDAVDHCFVATASGRYQGQGDRAGLVARELGLAPAHVAAVDQTSAAGGATVHAACRAVASGVSDLALAVGAERMTHRSTADLADTIAGVTHPAAYKHGVTLPTFAGLAARGYLERHDAPREALAEVAVKNHAHGVDNPKAHFRDPIDAATVLSSPVIADPLRLYDFCPISDGGAAVLCCPAADAERYADEYAVVAGTGGATDTHVVHERPDPTWLGAVDRAAGEAYAAAGIRPADLDLVECHDMFTILEVMQLEALGLAGAGEGWRLAPEGVTHRDGSLPVNTSGGLKAKGHPIAASGLAQVVELAEQLTGRAGARQVDADRALACNVGGFGNCAVVTVLASGDAP